MYDFHYNFMKKNFDAEALITDRDSLAYEMKSGDVYEKFFKWKNLFDFSNKADKKVVGKMKDKFEGVTVHECVGLKSKMYSIKK